MGQSDKELVTIEQWNDTKVYKKDLAEWIKGFFPGKYGMGVSKKVSNDPVSKAFAILLRNFSERLEQAEKLLEQFGGSIPATHTIPEIETPAPMTEPITEITKEDPRSAALNEPVGLDSGDTDGKAIINAFVNTSVNPPQPRKSHSKRKIKR